MPFDNSITLSAYSARRRSSSVSCLSGGTATGLPPSSSATKTITQCVHSRSLPPIGSRALTSTAKCIELVPV